MSRSMRRNERSSAPWIQIVAAAARSGSAAVNASTSSAATMTCLGATILMQWASEGPTRLVLSSATTPPTLVMPSQMAMYSGRFGISRQTTSPLRALVERPAGILVRAFGERRDRSGTRGRRAGPARRRIARRVPRSRSGRMRSGLRVMGAVSSSARSQALAAEPLPLCEFLCAGLPSCRIPCVDGKHRAGDVFRSCR